MYNPLHQSYVGRRQTWRGMESDSHDGRWVGYRELVVDNRAHSGRCRAHGKRLRADRLLTSKGNSRGTQHLRAACSHPNGFLFYRPTPCSVCAHTLPADAVNCRTLVVTVRAPHCYASASTSPDDPFQLRVAAPSGAHANRHRALAKAGCIAGRGSGAGLHTTQRTGRKIHPQLSASSAGGGPGVLPHHRLRALSGAARWVAEGL
jgi:hypothetical protein